MADRRARTLAGTLSLAALLAIAGAAPLAAQGRGFGPVRGRLGIGADLALPVGQFHQYVDNGFGVRGFGLLALDPYGILGLRLDGSYVVYGHQSRVVPLSPTVPLIDVRVNTDNQIVFGSLGPQLTFPIGPVRPFLRGGVGVSYFVTTSSVKGTSNTSSFAQTTNFHDTRLALEGGGGLWIHLGGSKTPIDLSLEATYVHNGRARYLRRESIVEQPDGSVTITPVRSGANLVTLNLGVVFGIR
jgi:hypothetical protein